MAVLPLARRPRTRRRLYGCAAAALALLSVFPTPYVARAQILPQDSNSAGLSSILGAFGGGFQNFASLLGAHQSVDVYLIIGRSHDVLSDVVKRLHLTRRPGFGDARQAEVKLARKVDVHSLTGGVIEVEAHDFDPTFAQSLAATYSAALRDRIVELARQHIDEKKALVRDRLRLAANQVAGSEAALDRFRSENRLAAPEAQLGAAVALKAGLEGRLQAKQVELQAAQQFATSDNIQVRAIQSEIGALQAEIGRAETPGAGASNLAGMAERSTEYLNLYRDVQFSQALLEVYTKYSEEVAVEEMVNNSNANVQLIEDAFVDPQRHFNIPPLALLLLVLLTAVYTEYYVPATGLHRRKNAG